MTEEKKKLLEEQLDSQQSAIAYDVREFTLEYYVDKYLKGIETDDNELYVPDYQREFIWDFKHQSRFIESLFLGLPVPFIFSAEIKETGRLEIVDGSQRIRTLAAFMNNELQLTSLQKMTLMNDCYYKDLPNAMQRIFKNISIRMIVLSSKATEEVRNEMFDRINTSSVPLLPMETRRGVYRGEFTEFIAELAKNKRFKKLCPVGKYLENRREEEELLLRLFAFREAFPNYGPVETKGVPSYLDNYLAQKNASFDEAEKEKLKNVFFRLINYIEKTYPKQGFTKNEIAVGVSRPYFEAIAVGTSLALDEKPDLKPCRHPEFVVNKRQRNEFCDMLDGKYKTHTAKKIRQRIEYVKNICLK